MGDLTAAPGVRVILIGGPSHAGKSTLAQRLADRLGWAWRSTDTLARHPGRPWPAGGAPVKPQVAEHYLTLSLDELIASVTAHYRGTVWPLAEAIIRQAVAGGEGLVLEGSALWPEDVAALRLDGVGAVWLTASPDLLSARILAGSGHAAADPDGRKMIERFLARAIAFDALVREAAESLGLPILQVTPGASIDQIADKCLGAARPIYRRPPGGQF
jgi:2-phosphoglycerate kinase